MAGCNHATTARRRVGKGSDMLVSHQEKRLPWRQFVAEPQTIFTRERQSQPCSSWVSHNCGQRVQFFWLWPHIFSAKALVDKIYGVVWRSKLSNVGCNHKRELSGPSRIDLVSVEDWTTSLKSLSCGWLNTKEWSNRGSSLLEHLLCDHGHAKVWGAKDSKGSWSYSPWQWRQIALNILNKVGEKGNCDNTNEWDKCSYGSTELLQCPDVCKTKKIVFHAPAASTGKEPSPKPSQQDGRSNITKAKKQYVKNRDSPLRWWCLKHVK